LATEDEDFSSFAELEESLSLIFDEEDASYSDEDDNSSSEEDGLLLLPQAVNKTAADMPRIKHFTLFIL
jgi:hypothetical protein